MITMLIIVREGIHDSSSKMSQYLTLVNGKKLPSKIKELTLLSPLAGDIGIII